MVREDADALGCGPEVEHARTIVVRGTSADRQVAHFNRLLAEGASREDALKGVVDHLIEETIAVPLSPSPSGHLWRGSPPEGGG
jgi:carboxylate-amine ligase